MSSDYTSSVSGSTSGASESGSYSGSESSSCTHASQSSSDLAHSDTGESEPPGSEDDGVQGDEGEKLILSMTSPGLGSVNMENLCYGAQVKSMGYLGE